jgi:hypothetical protein
MSKNTVTAADLRAYFNADVKRLAVLSPDARKTVEFNSDGKAPRGRIHPEAVKVHNQRRKVQYVTGATKQAVAAQKEQAKKHREQAKAAGLPVGARGPLSNAAKAKVGLDKPQRRTRKG